MDTSVLQRLVESLHQRREELVRWLSTAPQEQRDVRIGPLGEEGVRRHLHTLTTALEKAEENALGRCTVCHETVETSRLEMDYTASVCLEHLTDEERTQLENDLELSQKVQRALLPQHVPHIPALEIAAFSQPAHIVGGDYFDFLRFKDGAHALVIADVMGKGVPASMLMASFQASLRIPTPENTSPSAVVSRLNTLFCHNIQLTKFVTFFLARYDEHTGLLTWCNAGHNPPLLRRADGEIESLSPTGAAIGLTEQTSFSQLSTVLDIGDRLILYTDGVVESQSSNRELFGEDRLRQVVSSSQNLSAQQLIGSLREHLQRHSPASTPSDDTTIVSIRVTSSPPS